MQGGCGSQRCREDCAPVHQIREWASGSSGFVCNTERMQYCVKQHIERPSYKITYHLKRKVPAEWWVTFLQGFFAITSGSAIQKKTHFWLKNWDAVIAPDEARAPWEHLEVGRRFKKKCNWNSRLSPKVSLNDHLDLCVFLCHRRSCLNGKNRIWESKEELTLSHIQ